MKRVYIKYFLYLLIFAIVSSIVMERIHKANTPKFLLNKYEELKNDKKLMDSIGGYQRFEYSHEIFYKSNYDSMIYRIMIFGKKTKLYYSSAGIIKKEEGKEIIKNEVLQIH